MYCSSCGIEVPDSSRYCSHCGTATFSSSGARPVRPLQRMRDDRKIAGVCSGIARYLAVDVTVVRILAVVLAIWPPSVGLIGYLVCWIVMPQDQLLLPPASNTSAEPHNATSS